MELYVEISDAQVCHKVHTPVRSEQVVYLECLLLLSACARSTPVHEVLRSATNGNTGMCIKGGSPVQQLEAPGDEPKIEEVDEETPPRVPPAGIALTWTQKVCKLGSFGLFVEFLGPFFAHFRQLQSQLPELGGADASFIS